jgi:hypothetical protein
LLVELKGTASNVAQMTVASARPSRISSPFKSGVSQIVKPEPMAVLAQVSVAPRTVCVGKNCPKFGSGGVQMKLV